MKRTLYILYTVSGITLLAAIGAGIFVYMIETKSAAIQGQAEGAALALQNADDAVIFDRTVKRHEATIVALEQTFVKEDEIVPFIEYVEEIGRSAGATFSIKEVEVKTRESGERYVSVSLSAEGAWESVFNSVLLLENMEHQATIAQAHFLKKSAEDSEGMWIGLITFEASIAQ